MQICGAAELAARSLNYRGHVLRYEPSGYGTRDEIIAELENNLGAHRSERRQRQAAECIAKLTAGAAYVRFGKIHYHVQETEE